VRGARANRGQHSAGITEFPRLAAVAILFLVARGGVEFAAGQEKVIQLRGGPIRTLSFSKEGSLLAVGCYDRELEEQKVVVLDPRSGKTVGTCWSGRHPPVACLAFSEDGKLVISDRQTEVAGEPQGEVTIWNYATGEGKKKILVNGQVILITSRYTVARVWPERTVLKVYDLTTGKATTLKGHTAPVEYACASADGKLLATSERKGVARLWQLPDGKEMPTLNLANHTLRDLWFLKDNHTLGVGSSGGTTFYDVTKSKITDRITFFYPLAISPDGRFMATYGEVSFIDDKADIVKSYPPNAINVWSRGKSGVVATLKPKAVNWRPTCMQFSPEGQLLAAGGGDGSLRVWDISMVEP
jgi:WD40 repeat protein